MPVPWGGTELAKVRQDVAWRPGDSVAFRGQPEDGRLLPQIPTPIPARSQSPTRFQNPSRKWEPSQGSAGGGGDAGPTRPPWAGTRLGFEGCTGDRRGTLTRVRGCRCVSGWC